MATRRQGLKRIKKRPLSERSEFRTLPVSVPGGACSPCEARTAIVGAAFLPHFFGGAKKRVGRRDEHPATPHGSERCNASPAKHQQQWRLASALCSRDATATATIAARHVKGNDPLPTRVTLRYIRYANTQGERGREGTTAKDHCNCNCNCNCNCRYAERPRQR